MANSRDEKKAKVSEPLSWTELISSPETIDFSDPTRTFDLKIKCSNVPMTFPKVYCDVSPVIHSLLNGDDELVLDTDTKIFNMMLNWMCRSRSDRKIYLAALSLDQRLKLANLGFKYIPKMKDECLEKFSKEDLVSSNMIEIIQTFIYTETDLGRLAIMWNEAARIADWNRMVKYPKEFWNAFVRLNIPLTAVLVLGHNVPESYIDLCLKEINEGRNSEAWYSVIAHYGKRPAVSSLSVMIALRTINGKIIKKEKKKESKQFSRLLSHKNHLR